MAQTPLPTSTTSLAVFSETIEATPAPKWHDHTCALDVCLWVAKCAKIYQITIDRAATADSAFQTRAMQILRVNWEFAGSPAVQLLRDELLELWMEDERSSKKKEGRGEQVQLYQYVDAVWEAIVGGAPSVTYVSVRPHTCGCGPDSNPSRVRVVMEGLGYNQKRWHGRLAQFDKTSDDATLEQMLHGHFSSVYSVKCVECLEWARWENLVEPELPMTMTLIDVRLQDLLIQTPMKFRYYTAPDLKKHEVEYVICGMVFHEADREHYVAFWQEWSRRQCVRAWHYDPMAFGRRGNGVEAVSPGAMMQRLRGSGRRGACKLVMLQRLSVREGGV